MKYRRSTSISFQSNQGFTLVELIAVIVILAIVGIGMGNFISTSAGIYVDTAERDEILAKSRFSVERLNRAVRYALPNSIRVAADEGAGGEVNAHCMEYIPIEWSTFYIDIATGADSGILTIEGPNMISALNNASGAGEYDQTQADNHYVVVYPTDPSQVHVTEAEIEDTDGRIVGLSAVRDSSTTGLVEVEFDNLMTFDEESTVERFYIVNQPISYCVVFESQSDGGPRYNLYKVSGYGFHETQIADIDVLTNATNGGTRILMAEDLSNDIRLIDNATLADGDRDFDATPFRVSDANLQRNSIVHTLLMFERNDEVVVFNNEIHLRNAP